MDFRHLIDLLFFLDVPLFFVAALIIGRWKVVFAAALFLTILETLWNKFSVGWFFLELWTEIEYFAEALLQPVCASVAGLAIRELVIWSAQSRLRALAVALASSVTLGGLMYFGADFLVRAFPPPWSAVALEIAKLSRPACSLDSVLEIAVPELPRFDEPATANLPAPRTQLDPKFSELPVIKDAWRNFIGPVISIHVSPADFSPDDKTSGIGVTAVVDEKGKVIDAAAISGPPQFYARALAIAHTWSFDPFLIEGSPRVVRIEQLGVSLSMREIRQPRVTSPKPPFDASDVEIKYQLRPGFGGASFDISLRGNGVITYDGDGGVALTGRHCARIPQANARRLIEEFHKLDFNSLADEYIGGVDGGTEYLTLTSGETSKTVKLESLFFRAGFPDAIWALPGYFSYTVQAQRWTTGNRYTAASLTVERWDFGRTDGPNLDMVAGIVTYGDATTLSDVIHAGAKVSTEPQRSFSNFSGMTSLEIAAGRSNLPMIKVLLSTSTRWPTAVLSNALVDVSAMGDIAPVRILLARGANVNHKNPRSSDTPVISAAASGRPDVVALLISSGALVGAKNQNGRTALHSAVTWLKAEEPILTGVDRAKVAELLLKAGANVNARDDDGNTPIMAEWVLGFEAAPILISHGADVNAHDDVYEHTALMLCRNPKVTQLLLEAGANPYAKDAFGNTALDTAQRSSSTDVVKVLQEWMATHPAPH